MILHPKTLISEQYQSAQNQQNRIQTPSICFQKRNINKKHHSLHTYAIKNNQFHFRKTLISEITPVSAKKIKTQFIRQLSQLSNKILKRIRTLI